MSSESVCQVACSWVYVGSFHMSLFGVVCVTCGDFHDGSEKWILSVHQILCQSWEKCYRGPHNNSTSLRGTNLELYAGVSMTWLVQDQLHISWQRWTHRKTHKLHNFWNCWTNSSAHPSGLMSDHSRHCWGGGNRLWDMPMGSDKRIRHVLCPCQICAQDPDRWSEAAVVSGKTRYGCHPPPTVLLIWHPVTSSYFQKWNWKDADLIPMRRHRPNRRECLTLWQKRTSRKCSKNGGVGETGVYIREGTTSRVTAADRPYGKFYDFYSVSLEIFGSTHVVTILSRRGQQ
jgi:hypothetical protein